MAVHQYIGARYVPKIFDNPAGGSDWAENTSYEPLTIVTYNNSSYTSKKFVPSTIGNPADNPDYWVVTGNYNAQIADLTTKIESISGSKINTYSAGYEGTLNKFSGITGTNIITENAKNNILRVLTLNSPIWNYETNGYYNYKALSDYYLMLCSTGANICGLQEFTFPKSIDALPLPTGSFNYQYYQPTLNFTNYEYLNFGNNILSTESGTFTSAIYTTYNGSEVRGYEKLVFTYAGKTISLYNTHLDAGGDSSYRVAQISELASIIGNDNNSVIIVTGDFNMYPDQVFNVFFAPLINAGLTPVNTSVYTWPRTNSTYICDNVWYKGCEASNTTYITDMPDSLTDLDHKGIYTDLKI